MVRRVVHALLLLATTLPAAALAQPPQPPSAAAPAEDGNWVMPAKNYASTRFSGLDEIKVSNVGQLEKKWEFTTGGDVSATPAVEGDTVYFPDVVGNLYAVDKWTGQQRWRTTISSATGVAGDKARATPAIAGGSQEAKDRCGCVIDKLQDTLSYDDDNFAIGTCGRSTIPLAIAGRTGHLIGHSQG